MRRQTVNKKIFGGTETKLVQYVEQTFLPEDSILRDVKERADQQGLPAIQVGKMDGLHLEVITRSVGAKLAVEIGTLGGYSGICITRGMGPDGKLFTFELEQSRADFARESFQKAGIAHQVEILVGLAIENLNRINKYGPFDLVFIDADKVSYPLYLKWASENLKIGGILLADNTFAWGMIADDRFDNSEDALAVKALKEFNFTLAQGGQFRSTILPTGEGLTFGVRVN
jgi:caffeoyl-CoA O-methyltransferase